MITAWLMAAALHGALLALLWMPPEKAEPLAAKPIVLARLIEPPPKPSPLPPPPPPAPRPPLPPSPPAPEPPSPLRPIAPVPLSIPEPSVDPVSTPSTTAEETPLEPTPAPAAGLPAPAPPPPPPPIASLPKPGRIPMEAHLGEYELGADPIGRGAIEISFPSDEQYKISLTVEAQRWLALLVRGQILVESEGRIDQAGLVPEAYRQGRPGKSVKTSTFDWTTGQARLDDGAQTLPLEPGLQDRLSVAFQIGWAAERRTEAGTVGLRPGEVFGFAVASRGTIHRMTFRVGDPEELVLPGGILVTAIRLTSDPLNTERAGTIDFWLDPADRHLPARIRYTEPSGRALDFLAIRSVFGD